jgi:PEP-CTERM motif
MSARRFPITALAVAMVLSSAARASADPVVLVTTLGPAPGYSSELAYGSSDQQQLYMGFQLAASAQVTSITAAVLFGNTVSNRLVASIWASESGLPAFSFGSRLDQIELAPPSDALEVNVSTVPEPGTLLLAASGLGLLSHRVRRRLRLAEQNDTRTADGGGRLRSIDL